MTEPKIPIVSLFSGALGLDLGLERAGFELRVAVECNRYAANTIRKNRPKLPLIAEKLEDVSTQEILRRAELQVNGEFIVTGGPSCQAYSTVGHRRSMGDPRGTMFREFLRVVREARPRFFVMENVRGVLSAAVKHRPLAERGPGHPPLDKDEQLGSAFLQMLQEIRELGYYTVFDLLNAADFGVPQTRTRLLFIGSRDGEPVRMPSATHAKDGTNGLTPWLTLSIGLQGVADPAPEYDEIPEAWKPYMEQVPEGGDWHDLPAELQPYALGRAHVSWGGRKGFFRRLHRNRPAPALTTSPASKATMLCHPTELRPLSVEEYARLQQFPRRWAFDGSVAQRYIQIGNAVPLGVGCACGRAVRRAWRQTPDPSLRGTIATTRVLLDRLASRPRTVLNPIRMRAQQDLKASRDWLKDLNPHRSDILEYVHAIEDEPGIPVARTARSRRSPETRRARRAA